MNRENLISSLRQIQELVEACLGAVNSADTSHAASPSQRKQARKKDPLGLSTEKPDFELPLRPFVNTYGRKMTGAARFALVLAHMAKGRTAVEVELASITRAWSKMTGLLDEFNRSYPTRAKDKGWVDSPKKHVYVLLPRWTEILRAAK
jgi:hypothetical protein